MDRDSLKLSKKLLNLRQAAQKLQVSVETLQYLSDRFGLVPLIDSKGEFFYSEEQLTQLVKASAARGNAPVG